MDIKPINTPSEPGKPTVIAGPCAAEDEQQIMVVARRLAAMGIRIMRAGVWKPRTKPGSFEGRGDVALDWLVRAKAETGLAIATEVATPSHVEKCLKHGIDVMWIGARTTTNPFAMQALADSMRGTDITVMVKNPVSPDVDLWIGALERLNNAGITRMAAIHRGFQIFGDKTYRNAPMWNIPIELRRRIPQIPIIGDPSHIGGRRDMVEILSQEALDMGFDGLMIECHPAPEKALSDAAQQLTPDALDDMLGRLIVRDRCNKGEELTAMRHEIDQLDDQLISILTQRMAVSRKIGRYKKQENMTVLQSARYNDILERRLKQCEKELSPTFMRHIFENIHEESIRQQLQIINT